MIKILNILTDTNIGGAGRYLINYLKFCDRSRFQVSVVLPRGSLLIPLIREVDIPVIEADTIADRSFSPEAIKELKAIIRARKPDIVHTHGSLSGRIAAKQCRVKTIYTRHCAFPVPGYMKKGPGRWFNRALNHHYSDHIIAVSPAAAENLTDAGIDEKRITVMMNGAEPLTRCSDTECDALRQKLGIPAGVFTGAILARLEAYKGHMILLDAAKELMDEGRDFRFLIAGSGADEAAIRSRIAELGLGEKVLMLGFVDNVAQILSILDVQLNCSYGTETSSIAIIEGMSIGIPSVISNYGGNPWLVDEGKSGLLFENKDSRDMAAKLRRLMDDEALRTQLQQGALEAYHSRFTGNIFAGNIENVYLKILNGRN